ncbi:hypothetical protein CQW23_26034 [Capsicum baccatum]|uniref:Uncharacterized protein n=1 Tax=Capsicum baccatum TaxID=33114 RepID=A0A2G2VMN0_CAPBA|nr:hypothetical protein CQW23_26034 [Capsicum baccatum]
MWPAKAKNSVGRAIYSDSDIYLLDDPFSAQTGNSYVQGNFAAYLICLGNEDGIIVQSENYNEMVTDHDNELLRHMVSHRKWLDKVNPSQKCSFLTKGEHQKNQIELEECFEDITCDNRITGRIQQGDAVSSRVTKCNAYLTCVTSAYKGALVIHGLQWQAATGLRGEQKKNAGLLERLIGIFVRRGFFFSIFGRAVMISTIAVARFYNTLAKFTGPSVLRDRLWWKGYNSSKFSVKTGISLAEFLQLH